MSVALSDDRFHAMLHGGLDAMYCLAQIDADDAPLDYRFTDVNAAGAKLIDVPADSLIGLTIGDVFSEANAELLTGYLTQVSQNGRANEFEVSLEGDHNHRLLRLQVIPLPDGLLVEAYDVTSSRDAQDALRKSEEYLTSVIANAPIIMYELDREGVFKLSAGRSLKQIGLKPGEAVGGSIYDFFAPDSPEVEAFQRALEGETVSTETRLGGGYFASRYTPRYDEAGNIAGILGVSYDVTERRNAEVQLQHAQRLEAVGQLTGGIAHDFNNLLAVILGNLDLLGDQELDERSRQLIENAVTATQRGATLTQRLLAFSRRQLLEPTSIEANTLINGMLDLLRHAIPESINVVFQPADELWVTHVDAAQLENAILNLCLNARDAMPSGGKLEIHTDNQIVDESLATRLQIDPGEYVAISIIDNGIGIDAEVAQKIFEPFFTTKETGKGSGLGLSMVYGFVNQSGGGIDLESTPDEGTRVSLLLPRATRAEQSNVQTEKVASEREDGQGELILVVEDDIALRRFVNDALISMNYRVLEAGDGHTAFGLIEQHDNIDLVLSDIVLPGELNGVALCRMAMDMRPGLKVILSTGYLGDVGDLDPAAIADLDRIPKPYRMADLAQKLRQVLDRS